MGVEPIVREKVQAELDLRVGRRLYLHLETTSGAYSGMNLGAFVRNAAIQFTRAVIAGTGPFRVGLQMEQGWVYAEGLTDYEVDAEGRLLLAGHDAEGRLAVALELSETPFPL